MNLKDFSTVQGLIEEREAYTAIITGSKFGIDMDKWYRYDYPTRVSQDIIEFHKMLISDIDKKLKELGVDVEEN
nr:MAG TPA: hypothetical protein [Caudoviricetes sp.]